MGSRLRVVLTNIGTFGDVNPLIALALELQARGHSAALAVPEMYRTKVEPLGIAFYPIRPDYDQHDARLAAMIYDIKKGTERGLREFLFPVLRESYADLLAAVRGDGGDGGDGGADLLLTGELAYAGPIVAEITGVPWASYVLAPFSFFSAYDPPVLPPYPMLADLQAMVPGMGHLVSRFARWVTRDWSEPVYALREELGLERGRSPIFEGKHSPALVLALFSDVLGTQQLDWPARTKTTGFVFYDGDAGKHDLEPGLESFLQAGPPPIVFTLGSAAVMNAGDFFEQSARAAELLGQRAVLLIGGDPRNEPKRKLPDTICVVRYAPYSQVFPRASVIVHQGGVGTTAQALNAGKPMLVMPYSHDQPDNARRVRRMGAALVVQRPKYKAARVAQLVSRLQTESSFGQRAAVISTRVKARDGVKEACDALEAVAAEKRLQESVTGSSIV